ncbi:hypothetical protein RCL_jg2727.t1 [Rhizophagus clarus]|uniref:Uncharacterized protein n=1 Tax=Rhizophagus clarus TaxID=94130 RepID=A0A8H3QZ77_9GLOM|nr:hypothetical protein RCL_jg3633.t1 [Rhizophagus clarus]GES99762.1 hypothetical protein RCL_jg2727.t1 [Rhizophagus clarus]
MINVLICDARALFFGNCVRVCLSSSIVNGVIKEENQIGLIEEDVKRVLYKTWIENVHISEADSVKDYSSWFAVEDRVYYF